MKRALFLDRDGIFNELVPWDGLCAPRHWGEVFLYRGLETLSVLKSAGYLLVLVTNQPDIERGVIDIRFVDELNAFLRRRYHLDGVYMCPHASSEHPWKKPNPGMLLQAQKDLSLDLSRSFFLGDTANDTKAAKAAGVKSILWDRPYNLNVASDFRINSLSAAIPILTEN